MRIDDYLSTVGAVKRRTIAKQLGTSGLLEVNGRVVKPSYDVKFGDIIRIKGSRPFQLEVIQVPQGSVPKSDREKYFRPIDTP